MKENQNLPITEKFAYGMGDAACNFYWKTFEFFLMFYYTDVFNLPAATAGTMFAVARILDGMFDPVMGIIADRTRSKYGKYRPYLLWCAIPLGVAAVMTFTTPDLGQTGRTIYAYVTYTLLMFVFSAINIPYNALMGVITNDSNERTSLSSFRFVGALSAGLLIVSSTKILVSKFGGDDPMLGWQLTMGFWAILASILFFVCFKFTNERVQVVAKEEGKLLDLLKDLAGNTPLFVLSILSIIIMTTFWIRSASSLYYFKYVVQKEHLFELMALTATFSTILGITLTKPLSKWMRGKKNAYISVLISSNTLILLFYLVPPSNLPVVFTLNCLIAFLLGPLSPLLFSMFADTIDYSEWRSGRRSSGLIFAIANFALKVGGAFAGWITGILLFAFGYAANQDQSPESIEGILLLMSIVPGLIGFVALIVLLFYPLNESKMRKISDEIEIARSQG